MISFRPGLAEDELEGGILKIISIKKGLGPGINLHSPHKTNKKSRGLELAHPFVYVYQ